MRKGSFAIDLVLRRLLEKGRIVYKRAYCDWGNYRDAVREFHTQGVELIDIPQSKASGKNSADIHMVVDALDLCNQKNHIDVVRADLRRQRLLAAGREAQGESEVGDRLRGQELHLGSPDRQLRRVHLLRRSDPRGRAEEAEAGAARARSPIRRARSEDLGEKLLEAVRSLERDYDTVWGSMLKQTIRRLYPGLQRGLLRRELVRRDPRDGREDGPDRARVRREPRQLHRAREAHRVDLPTIRFAGSTIECPHGANPVDAKRPVSSARPAARNIRLPLRHARRRARGRDRAALRTRSGTCRARDPRARSCREPELPPGASARAARAPRRGSRVMRGSREVTAPKLVRRRQRAAFPADAHVRPASGAAPAPARASRRASSATDSRSRARERERDRARLAPQTSTRSRPVRDWPGG